MASSENNAKLPSVAGSRKKPIFILEETSSWTAALQPVVGEKAISRYLTIQSLIQDLPSSFGTVVIIEFERMNHDGIKTVCESLINFDNPAESIFLAVGNSEIKRYARQLGGLGFAGVFSGRKEFPALVSTMDRFWNTLTWPSQTIEDAVEANFPW